jgi:hypothetical protein
LKQPAGARWLVQARVTISRIRSVHDQGPVDWV